MREIDTFKKDIPFYSIVETENTAPGGSLAATAFPYQTQSFSLLNVEGHAVHGFDIRNFPLENAGCHREVHVQVFNFYQMRIIFHYTKTLTCFTVSLVC